MSFKHTAALALAFTTILPAVVFAQAPTAALPGIHAGRHAGGRVQRVMGLVSAVNNGSITVTPRRDPTPVMFTLAANARVLETSPAALSDIQTGNAVRVAGTVSTDGTAISARQVTLLPALPGGNHKGRQGVTSGKFIMGTVASVAPLKVTLGDGSVVAVNTESTTRVNKLALATPAAITVGSHITAGLSGPATARVARMVTILPARRGRKQPF